MPCTRLHPLAQRGLDAYAPGWERWLIDESDTRGYWQLLGRLWAEPGYGDLVVIEHDVEIHNLVLPEFADCREPWCTFPYQGPGPTVPEGLLLTSLGCVRFTAELREAVPDAVVRYRPDGAPEGDWRRLDVRICHELQMAGVEVHVHEPPVRHHHVYAGRCACGLEHD